LDFLSAWALTLIIEGVALFIIFHERYAPFLIARNAFIASSLTLPFVWFVFPALGMGWGPQTALAETFAVVVEGGIYAALFSKIDKKGALLASVACNFASFIIGLSIC